MNASRRRRAGFTLIELLTVIAIIAILTAFTAAVLPNMIDKARMTEVQNIANQLRILLTAYYADHGTYPPMYGYIKPEEFGTPGTQIVQPDDFITVPWMALLGVHGNLDLYDPFSDAVDINGDDRPPKGAAPGELGIEMLEYSPVGGHDSGLYAVGEVDSARFFTRLYEGIPDAVLDDDIDLQRLENKRPLIYIPINKRQFNRVSKNWYDQADAASAAPDTLRDNDNPRPNDVAGINAELAGMRFPPPTYDAYVLISLGPFRNYPTLNPLYGLLYDSRLPDGLPFLNLADPAYPAILNGGGIAVKQLYRYHYMAMASYFMATRDADDNGVLDFDYLKRKNEDEAAYKFHRFEDPNLPNLGGPLIFLSP